MKAKVIKTGEIVNVVPVDGGWCDTDYSTYSRHYSDKELDFDIQDWESFRREAAKDILCAVISGGVSAGADSLVEEKYIIVKESIKIADELIRQLKEDEK